MQASVDDLRAKGLLEDIRDSLQANMALLPDAVIRDIDNLLHMLVTVKRDNVELWMNLLNLKSELAAKTARLDKVEGELVTVKAELVEVKAELVEVKAELAEKTTRLVQVEGQLFDVRAELSDVRATLTSTQQRLAVRQIYHALNEKLLRKMSRALGMDIQSFWKTRVSNVGGFRRTPDMMRVWRDFQAAYDIDDDPSTFWEELKDGKFAFDCFVHAGSFPSYRYEEVLEIADAVFVGQHERHRWGFLRVLEITRRLSEEEGVGLYEY
jgi:hypothetical protein